MIKKTTLLLLCLISLELCAQKSYDINNRQGGLFFSVGSEYRITPIYSMDASLSGFVPVSVDLQNSGVAFFYAFDYFVTKNLSLGFSNSIRYDLHMLPIDEIEGDFGVRAADKTFIFGFHFYLNYHVKVFENSELFIRLGKSFLNGGTEFREKASFYDDNGDLLASLFTQEDFEYQPWNFGIGYKKNKVSLMLGAYTTSVTNYFNDGSAFIVPYVQFKYNLGKL